MGYRYDEEAMELEINFASFLVEQWWKLNSESTVTSILVKKGMENFME